MRACVVHAPLHGRAGPDSLVRHSCAEILEASRPSWVHDITLSAFELGSAPPAVSDFRCSQPEAGPCRGLQQPCMPAAPGPGARLALPLTLAPPARCAQDGPWPHCIILHHPQGALQPQPHRQ